MVRVCASPSQFGNEDDTTVQVTFFLASSTVQVPNSDRLRRMIPAYSSGVAVMRLLDAILGTSPATWIWAKRPSAVKIKMPLGVSPNGNDFLPSGAVTSAITKFQLPTIWSLRLFAGCAAAAPADRASASKAAVMVLGFILSPR